MDIHVFFADAMRLHQAGSLEPAERLYRRVLGIDPGHSDALYLLGAIAYQKRRLDLAVDLIEQAIAIIEKGRSSPGPDKSASYFSTFADALRDQGKLDEAIASYRRALDFKPNFTMALNNLGDALNRRGSHDEAALCYRKAIDLNPNLPDAHYNLGAILQDQGRVDDAVECYRRALELRPAHAEACNNLGVASQLQGRLEDAIDYHSRAIALKADFADAYHNLASARQQQGRFDEAEALFRKSLQIKPDFCMAYYGLSGCRKFRDADRPIALEIKGLLSKQRLTDTDRTFLHFALGKIFDDLGDYGEAIQHFDEANRLERMHHDFNGQNFAASVDCVISAFPKETLTSPAASDSELPILIVGMPRSGTTLTEQILANHARIGTAGEVNFWFQQLEKISNRHDSQIEDWAEQDAAHDYVKLLTGAAPGVSRVIDKMPYNFLVLGLLHRVFPKARIIHCRRNPLDTALSIYFSRFNPIVKAQDFAYNRRDIVLYYRQYLRLMEHWRAILPPERFLEIDYENLVAKPESTSRTLVSFCGLDWDPACLAFYKTDRPIATASAWQARQPIYRSSAQRWLNYEPWLGEFRELQPSDAP
jgi:tetratricopeptide (TPR) repeat protein